MGGGVGTSPELFGRKIIVCCTLRTCTPPRKEPPKDGGLAGWTFAPAAARAIYGVPQTKRWPEYREGKKWGLSEKLFLSFSVVNSKITGAIAESSVINEH